MCLNILTMIRLSVNISLVAIVSRAPGFVGGAMEASAATHRAGDLRCVNLVNCAFAGHSHRHTLSSTHTNTHSRLQPEAAALFSEMNLPQAVPPKVLWGTAPPSGGSRKVKLSGDSFRPSSCSAWSIKSLWGEGGGVTWSVGRPPPHDQQEASQFRPHRCP